MSCGPEPLHSDFILRRFLGRTSTRPFGDDGLAAREHGDELCDLPRAPGRRLHVVGSKRQREQVHTAERAERLDAARGLASIAARRSLGMVFSFALRIGA